VAEGRLSRIINDYYPTLLEGGKTLDREPREERAR
jgi:hypothetical protein